MTDAGHTSDDTPDALPDEQPVATGAPPVVAVVVTHDPGPWLEETLAALADQDYPNLSVLVLDAASTDDPTPRVASILPAAYVRRVDENRGFGATANDVLSVVEGASHFLMLHDDVAADPDAVRLLVEEAYRSNAGVVSPKFVAWDDVAELLAVGSSADKSGFTSPYGRGERDQEQHDAVRDVFVAPGGCQLVRADLFATLGGFDPAMAMFGEDLDLSWRAQIAGARVVVAPSARVRHLEAAASGRRSLPVSEAAATLQQRHRVRSMLVAYKGLHLVRVLPQAFALMLVEGMLGGREGLARTLDAWRHNIRGLRGLRERRKAVQATRMVRDSEVRRLQARGSARLGSILRGGLEAEERTLGVAAASRQFAGAVSRGGLRLTVTVWASLLLVLVVGGRHLITGRIPAVGQFAPFPPGLETLWLFVAGWHPAGLGSSAPPPVALFLLGAGTTALFGAQDLLQKVLVLGMLPLGIAGMHRLTAPLTSWRPRLVAAVLYAAVPLPYDALARGRWSALLAYGVMPWFFSRLLRASGIPPFGAPAVIETTPRRPRRLRSDGPRTASDAIETLLGAEAGTLDAIDTEELRIAAIAVAGRPDDLRPDDRALPPPAQVRHPGTFIEQAVPAAIVLALAAALAPPVATAALLAGVGLLAGSVLVGTTRAGLRSLALAAAAVAGAVLLLTPWSLDVLVTGATWSGVLGVGAPRSDAPSLAELLRLHVGDVPAGGMGWALFGAAMLPLVVGRRWRFEWAARLWAMAVVVCVAALALGRGWMGLPPAALDVLLAPAAVAIVLSAALGLAAFEIDLPGYRFGWRQVASLAAAGAGVASLIPMVASSVDGRWRLPPRDFASLLSWMPDRVEQGDFRVLWVGSPDALPLEGWRLSDGLAYASSRNGPPDATLLWPGSDSGSTGLLADALAVARRGETTRLGKLLGPLGVRYVAVPLTDAPGRRRADVHGPPEGVLEALRGQVDLRLLQTDDALVLFENAAWRPIRSSGGQPVLDPGSPILRSSGPAPAGEVLVADSYSSRWQLEVAGRAAPRTKADGWALSFAVSSAGDGTLRYRTPPLRYVILAFEALLWIVAARTAIVAMRRRSEALARDGAGAAGEEREA